PPSDRPRGHSQPKGTRHEPRNARDHVVGVIDVACDHRRGKGAKPLKKCAPGAVMSGTVRRDMYEASGWRGPGAAEMHKSLVAKIQQMRCAGPLLAAAHLLPRSSQTGAETAMTRTASTQRGCEPRTVAEVMTATGGRGRGRCTGTRGAPPSPGACVDRPV